MSSTHRPSRRRRGTARATALAVAVVAPFIALLPAEARATQVTWSDQSVVAGKNVTATVDPGSVSSGDEVVLQRRFPDMWRTADAKAKSTAKGLVLKVPTDQYGTFTYRIVAVQGGNVVDTSDTASLKVKPSYNPVGAKGSYNFLSSPRWRWDSCGPVTWQFNSDHSAAKGLAQIMGALHRAHQATGLDFKYVGKTNQRPNTSGSGINGSDIIIGWLRAKAFQSTTGSSGAVGVGGARFSGGWKEADGTQVSKALSGGVVLNAKYNGRLKNGFGKGFTWGDVIMHEFGHVLGLGHVGSSKQLMFGTITARPARWGAGDLTGLSKVGNNGGCLIPNNNRPGRPRSVSAF